MRKIIESTIPKNDAAIVNQVKPDHDRFLKTLPANIHIPMNIEIQEVMTTALCAMPAALSPA
jgi:hypothetical protein